MTATASDPATVAAPRRLPTVLAVLVVRDAEGWIRECLAALASQTYPRFGVLAVDDGSADGSHEVLVQALGEGRVVRRDRRVGIARSVAEAVALPVATQADHLLLVHDDVALDPDAVTRLVEATMIPGVEHVGIVGAKIVDWDRPRVLRDVGRSADRFGHPFSSLQPDELDQGQFDRVLEVLTVDGCAMLIARDAWQQVGLFDERLGDDHTDLDLCWRVRVAGWRVLMTPLARARHRAAGEHETGGGRSRRYDEDRAALATVLKNYSGWSLVKVLPIAVVLTLGRLVYLALSRRFEEAFDVFQALWWNVAHLPGTWSRRRRVQKARSVRDRALRRFTESAGLRLPRWFQTAERILEEQRGIDEEGAAPPRLRDRTVSLVAAHPVMVTTFLGIVVAIIAGRELLGTEPLAGGSLTMFPPVPGAFLTELVAGYRSTGLGGSLAASPALALLGAISTVAFGSTAIAEKVLLGAAPVLAAVLMYRSAARRTGRPGPSVVAAVAYGLSGLMAWATSDGRLALLAVLVVLPPLVERLEVAFARDEPSDGVRRLAAGLAVTLAVGIAFYPGVVLPIGLVVALELVAGRRRGRGIATVGLALAGAAILSFTFVPTLVADGGAALGTTIGTSDPLALGRLAIGGGPGTWVGAWFLPVGAVLSLALVRTPFRAPAWRAAMAAALGLAFAWLSAAWWLPPPLANAPAYAALAAVGEALLIAYGLSSAVGTLGRESFGFRQVGTALLTAVLAAGIFVQSVAAMTGRRAVGGPERIPAAWAVIDGSERGDFRVLWVGGRSGEAFPPPGGDPNGVVEAGDATLRFGLTDRSGASALDTGRPLVGPGADALRTALAELLGEGTVHGGALLAPFGVRYVVVDDGDLPEAAAARFAEQVDLDRVPASGLVIFRNASVLPTAATYDADEAFRSIVTSDGSPDVVQRLRAARGRALTPVEGGWDGDRAGALTVVSSEFDDRWTIEDADSFSPTPAFGWATAFDGPTDAQVRVRFGGQLPRTVASIILAALWAAALWITRRPVAR